MSRTGPRNKYANYAPSQAMLDAVEAWETAVKAEEDTRHAARAAIAEELRTAGVSHEALAKHVPWTEATVTGIAKEYKVPPLRKRKAADPEN
ncbi:hypothetical protein [Streptomyces sp. NPDC058548]|uniref:hypothetical protein n=1 Tax=Streptomyces sp. NPDC058548 TaxID=3346545 RepID=UPI00365D3E7C